MSWVPVVKLASWPQVSCFVFLVINLRQYWPIMVRSTFLRASANKNNEMNHQLILGRNEIQSRMTLCTQQLHHYKCIFLVLEVFGPRLICVVIISHTMMTNFSPILYLPCIVFYLYCICTVYVLYLYCICTVFVFVLYLWSNYGSHNVGRLHHPIMGHNRRHTTTGASASCYPNRIFRLK